MRRLPRPIAIALPIAVAALWIHSQFFHMAWQWASDVDTTVSRDDVGRSWGTQVTSCNGRITFELHSEPRAFLPELRKRRLRITPAEEWRLFNEGRDWSYGFDETSEGWSFIGFGHDHVSYDASSWRQAVKGLVSIRSFSLPLWALFLLACLPLARRLLLARRQAKLAGCCTKCGYDLRATPDRCPECGTAVGPATPTPAA